MGRKTLLGMEDFVLYGYEIGSPGNNRLLTLRGKLIHFHWFKCLRRTLKMGTLRCLEMSVYPTDAASFPPPHTQELKFLLRRWERFIPNIILTDTARWSTQDTPSIPSPEQPTTFLQSFPTELHIRGFRLYHSATESRSAIHCDRVIQTTSYLLVTFKVKISE